MNFEKKSIRIAVLQRVCTGYRTELFGKLSREPGVEAMLFVGEDIPDSKVKNHTKLDGIKFRKLRTRFITLGKRVLPWHVGLVDELKAFGPDAILCEGESHFLGYLQAVYYKLFRDRRVGLMHWCFISLPGWPAIGGGNYRSLIKKYFRRFFDAFVVYSSYSKDCLLKLGQPPEKVFVATNVGDIQRFIGLSDKLPDTIAQARSKVKLPEKFTVLYLGTLDQVKRPDVMLDLAKKCDSSRFNFVLLGSGPELESLRGRSKREGLSNIHLPGRIVEDLPLYYRASDVLLIPGRGGIVISEAMAFGIPVIVHQADGTEYDLVVNGETGILLEEGGVEDFRRAIETLAGQPELCASMSEKSKDLIRNRFTTDNMVKQIVRAARFAMDSRRSTQAGSPGFRSGYSLRTE